MRFSYVSLILVIFFVFLVKSGYSRRGGGGFKGGGGSYKGGGGYKGGSRWSIFSSHSTSHKSGTSNSRYSGSHSGGSSHATKPGMRPSATKTSIYNPKTVKVPLHQSRYERPLQNQAGSYPKQQYGPINPPPYSQDVAHSAPPPSYNSLFPGYHAAPPAYHTLYPGNPPRTNIHYGQPTIINNGGGSSGYVQHHNSDNSLLGLYVGYKIGQWSSHNHYMHQSSYTGRNYEVHHYYHGRESVPNKATLESNSIKVCKPETKDMCVGSSVPLCMKDETFLCVADPKTTVPCKHNSTLYCVNAVVPCMNSTDSACGNSSSSNNTTIISMPCISYININGSFNGNMFNNSITTPNQTYDKGNNDSLFCVTILAAPVVNNIGVPIPGQPLPEPKENEKHLAYGVAQGELWLKKLVYNIWG